MQRLRPDDDYFLCLHREATPMQIGALQLFAVSDDERHDHFVDDVLAHLAGRIPSTALARVRRSAPFHVDTDAWFATRNIDLDRLTTVINGHGEMPRTELHANVARWVTERLDPQLPPFRVVLVPRVEGGSAAMFLTILHALADGVGFQSIVAALTDDGPTPAPPLTAATRGERIPMAPEWFVRSGIALLGDKRETHRTKQARTDAQAALDAYKQEHRRAKTPKFALSGATSTTRSYDAASLPLERFRAIARALGGTVNDVFLSVGSGAVRAFLLSIDALPDDPIVVNAARSYRRPEHGDLGNRIVSLHPHLATDVEDPIARFHAIRASMATEVERSRLQEPLMDQPAVPFGARRLRARMAERVEGGGAVLPGNVSLSNVPGPDTARFLAGYRMTASYPTPIIGSGRFLNITLRRYVDHLDLGIMTDAAKVPEASTIRGFIERALDELEVASRRAS